MVIALQRLLALSKNQQYLITNNSMVLKQNSIRIFLSCWKKEWLTECQGQWWS